MRKALDDFARRNDGVSVELRYPKDRTILVQALKSLFFGGSIVPKFQIFELVVVVAFILSDRRVRPVLSLELVPMFVHCRSVGIQLFGGSGARLAFVSSLFEVLDIDLAESLFCLLLLIGKCFFYLIP